MFRHVVQYRIGLKKILREQWHLCDLVLSGLYELPTSPEELRFIGLASHSMREYFSEDLGLKL